MIAGLFSSVCTRLGAMASFSSAAIEPAAFTSLERMFFFSRVCPTTILPSRFCRSAKLEARQKIAMTSDATVMSKPSSREKPLETPPSEETIERSARSFMSTTRRQLMRRVSSAERIAPIDVIVDQRGEQVVGGADGVEVAGEMEVDVLHRHDLGVAAAGRAALDAETWAERLGSRRQHSAFLPMWLRPSVRPTVVVVLPSPAGVGVIAVTRMSLPSGRPLSDSIYSSEILPL